MGLHFRACAAQKWGPSFEEHSLHHGWGIALVMKAVDCTPVCWVSFGISVTLEECLY